MGNIAKEMQNTIHFLAPLIADQLTDDEELKDEFVSVLLQAKVVEMGDDAYAITRDEEQIEEAI